MAHARWDGAGGAPTPALQRMCAGEDDACNEGKGEGGPLAPLPVMSKCASMSLHEVASFVCGSRSVGSKRAAPAARILTGVCLTSAARPGATDAVPRRGRNAMRAGVGGGSATVWGGARPPARGGGHPPPRPSRR